MKRILHVITDLPVGGAETTLYRFLARTDRNRFESKVICLGKGGEMSEPIEHLGVSVTPVHRSLRRLHKHSSAFRPDLIQGWLYHGNMASLIESFLLMRKVPVVWNIRHSLNDLKGEKRMTAFLIRAGAWMSSFPAKITFDSNTSAEQHKEFGYRSSRFLVTPNGFDCDEFKPDPAAKASVCRELGLDEDTILISLFARYHPVKDHGTFLKAASLLLHSGVKANFVLAGNGIDAANPALTQLVADCGIGAAVRLLGVRRDMPRLNAAVDIATSSSRTESFSNVIGEAMACGVPCVVTDVGDSADIVGDTGKVVASGNADAIASAWRELAALDREERRKLGMQARDRIIQRFSLGHIVSLFENMYMDLIVS